MANLKGNCCNLVGNFPSTAEGLISVSSKGNTGFQYMTDGTNNEVTIEPSTGVVSISAYATNKVHDGCAGSATVNINWLKKTDCNKYIYLYAGQGKATIKGDIGGLADFASVANITNPITVYNVVEASAASGPASLYTNEDQEDGIGLIYKGQPWTIDTSNESECVIDLTAYGIGGYGECRLQSISLQTVANKIPIVNMSFIYNIN
jgi:hypothetical protein